MWYSVPMKYTNPHHPCEPLLDQPHGYLRGHSDPRDNPDGKFTDWTVTRSTFQLGVRVAQETEEARA